MNLELKIFIYWLILLSISYIIAKLDWMLNCPNIYFKYYDSFTNGLFMTIKYLGLFGIIVWLFAQFTNYFWKGEFFSLIIQ